ncbi:peptidoglycan editing factor PgeF [Angustibacter peucedani]
MDDRPGLAWTDRLADPAGDVHLAFTDRRGGRSRAPYEGLNLGAHVGDDAVDVAANRADVAGAVGIDPARLVVASQVHGREVVQVDAPFDGPPPEADAMVTTAPGLALAVLVADCVPVLLAAPAEGVVAVAHAGRPGMAVVVVLAAVAAMRDLGVREVVARLAPSVCPRCYEVPLALREEVAAVAPASRSVTWTGTPALDVAAGVLAQLADLGVAARQLPGCTVERPDLFSYRRDGRTGRFAGLVWRTA